MKASELKKSHHEKIDQVNDADLFALNFIVHKQERVYQIPKEFLENVGHAEKDFGEGRFYTLNDFEEKHKE